MQGWLMGSVSLILFAALAYRRSTRMIYTVVFALWLLIATHLNGISLGIIFAWLFYIAIFIPLNVTAWRYRYITRPIFQVYRKLMPTLSRTEREAIASGTITWEGDLFHGNPDWNKLLALQPVSLSSEEQAFLDGPVEQLCRMINDWDITHNRADLPPEMWQFLKDQGFFGLIIPKQYGGKGFSAYAHSQVIVKVGGISSTVSTTISVPNSLGPAELLLHYGTEEQKQHYLPRLAKGEEVPCFALTSPDAGSDASAMLDNGVVCYGDYQGEKILGIRLNWNKRYITLAPIATVIGLAFKLYDPDHLIGKKESLGITCALIPRNTPGITIGRRHFPLNNPFQNGPIQGKDVFIPISDIIGGLKQAGQGWHMLMECLASGRAITLPSSALGGAKVGAFATGAYARIRKQFHLPIGCFEGIEEPLARIGAMTYIMDAARELVVAAVDKGEKPAVASAIVKYMTTELGRKVCCDSMDIHGGKGICLGPRNYIGRSYEAIPIAITVEGANILTRNMIVFGQGAIRCHPYVLAELEAASLENVQAGLIAFDKAIMRHIGFGISNVVRSFVLACASARGVSAPSGKVKRYYQHATRFSSALALMTDVTMLVMGGNLKRKESISARLGDILGYLYLLSAVLKRFHVQGEKNDDLPLVRYAAEYCLYEIQGRFNDIIKNYPRTGIGYLLRMLVFPLGMHFSKPKDKLNHKITQLLMAPGETRARLTAGVFATDNVLAELQDALIKAIAAEPIEKIIKEAKQAGRINGHNNLELAQAALNMALITSDQFDLLMHAETAARCVIAVDDFTNEELARVSAKASYTTTYVNHE